MIETAIVPFPERFLSDLYDGESKQLRTVPGAAFGTVCAARGPRRLTCAEQPFLLKLGIILISGQTVQKPRLLYARQDLRTANELAITIGEAIAVEPR